MLGGDNSAEGGGQLRAATKATLRRQVQTHLGNLCRQTAALEGWLEHCRHQAIALLSETRSLRAVREASAVARLEREAHKAVSLDAQLHASQRIESETDRRAAQPTRPALIHVAAERRLQPGRAVVVESPAPKGPFAATFSDDGEVGYFYALDTRLESEHQIRDALHVYDVADIIDHAEPSVVQISWTGDGTKAVLSINGCVHAVFDFNRLDSASS